ncbi:sulfatase [Nannocystis sp.]|uniref:sulfatase n=1 Tax=Nannocystis sp. TaxID=1962667 RepID=UPI0025D5358F|nr:sulfatase [Nannocystis sp.]MBK7826073.1 sulfatase [Nannocystis sp.]
MTVGGAPQQPGRRSCPPGQPPAAPTTCLTGQPGPARPTCPPRQPISTWLTRHVLPVSLVLAACSAPAPALPNATPVPGTPSPEPAPAAPPSLAPVARIEAADRWQDLLAQRPSALSFADDRLVVDLGRASARAVLELVPTSPWRLAQDLGDARTGLIVGAGGSLSLPLDGDLAPALHPDVGDQPGLALALTLRALRPGQAMTVLWNELPLAHLQVGELWERRTFSLPAAAVKPGENRLRLHFARPAGGGQATAAIQRVELGPRAVIVAGPARSAPSYTVATAVATTVATTVTAVTAVTPVRGDSDELALDLSPGTALVYYVQPPRRGRLRLDIRGRGSLRVRVSSDADHREGRPPTALLEEPLRPTGARHELDLSGYGGVPLRLEIAVGGAGEGAGARLRALDLIARRSTPVDHRSRKLRDLYIFAVEGARPDDLLGVLLRGPRFAAVERLSHSALVFERAYACAPWAVPSHSALLSAMAPPVHATVGGTYVAAGQQLLPELLDRAGYHGLVVAANPDLSGERGLTQGFDASVSLSRGTGAGNDAEAVIAAVLAGRGARPPRFVYADLVDPQAPYDPPRELLAGLLPPEGAPLPHLTHLWLGRVRTGAIVPDAAQRDYLRRLYRGELQRVDAALGQLLDALEADGSLDEAIVVLVGVHGEEFFEHGSVGHGFTLHEESLRVPLAIRAPALLAPGRVSAPVDLLDLAPTLADLLGLPFPAAWQGDTLVPVIDDPQPPPRLVVAYLGDGSRAAIVGDLKLILGSGRDSQRFYDLGLDPGEQVDRLGSGGVGLRIVRSALAWELAAPGQTWKRARWGTGADLRPAFAVDHGM